MAAYFVARVEIHDAEAFGAYAKRFGPVFAKYNGKVLAADAGFEVLEGEVTADRLVIIEFPDEADFKAWYRAPEYQELVALRAGASSADVVLLHGL